MTLRIHLQRSRSFNRNLTEKMFVCLFVLRLNVPVNNFFQSCRDGATTSWVINQYFRGVKCLAQGHNTAAVGFEPPTSRSGVRHSTTEPPRSPQKKMCIDCMETLCLVKHALDMISFRPWYWLECVRGTLFWSVVSLYSNVFLWRQRFLEDEGWIWKH